MISLTEFSSNTSDCCVFKFLPRSVDRKRLMYFQIETSLFFRSVDAALGSTLLINVRVVSTQVNRYDYVCFCDDFISVRLTLLLFWHYILPRRFPSKLRFKKEQKAAVCSLWKLFLPYYFLRRLFLDLKGSARSTLSD